MKKTFMKVMAWVLVICAMQVALVPAVSAAGTSVTYDFYSRYSSYDYFYHWRTVDDDDYFDSATELAAGTTVARADIAADYDNSLVNWKIEYGGGYGSMATGKTGLFSSTGWVDLNLGKGADVVFRLKAPETANYKITLNYITTESTTANTATEIKIVPAAKSSYSTSELSALLSQYARQAAFSCYEDISGWGANCKKHSMTISESYPFLESQDYFLVVSGGSTGGHTFLQSMTVSYAGEYVEPEVEDFPRPVTILEEALTRWEEGFPMVAEAGGEDYLAIPIYGGRMYVFNMETNQLVDVVNTGIDVPRGATADDNGVIYIAGDSYNIFMYDLNTSKPSKSTKVNISGVALGSLYDLSYGEDGNIYTGSDNGHVIRYEPSTDTVTAIHLKDLGITDPTYVSSVIQQGDYIYAAVTTKAKTHYLVKLTNTETAELVGIVEYTSTKPSTYMSYMSITDEGLILGTATNLMAVDTNTMSLLTAEEFGSDAPIQVYVSEAIDGKYYYVSNKDRYMYEYDPNATDGNQVIQKAHVGQFFDCHGKTITLDHDGDGVDERYLLAIEGAKKYEITLVNPVTGSSFKVKLPIDENAGASTGVNSLTNGLVGSNELYYGGFTSNQVQVFNTAEGKLTGQINASGIQTDSIHLYNGDIYVGNYTEAQLTRLHRDTNKPEVLMTLHNSLFDQSRIHGITSGDDKVFFGTFPYVYKHGGVIAWYDLTTNRSYVVAGPNPEDVYYAEYSDTGYDYNASKPVVPVSTVKWYNEVTGEQVTAIENWTGVVENQGIKDVAYHNGILYAATSRSGGTNTSYADGTSAVVIAYDVAARQVIATFDPATQGFTSPVPTVSGIEMDENGTLWCIVSETLFTLTLNEDNTFTYIEKVSFDKYGYDATQNRANSTIVFDGNGYVYAAFERLGGLCKVNMTNPSDYTKLMPNVTSNGQVPNSFALGEDGNLYFLLGSSLKMLTLNETEAEWTAADVVTAQIAAITEETTSDVIAQIRADYNALTLREQSLVQNYSTLIQAEADALIADIAALGEITWEKKAQVEALLATYQSMPMSQQELVTNYYVLATANKELLMIESKSPVLVENTAGEKTYYQNLEDAVAEATEGTITLREDIAAEVVNVNVNVVLDLNGYTLTVNSISGNVKDSADGKGLIKTGEKNAVLTAADDQLILWDNAVDASGYRLFDYTFTNEGVDRNKNKSDAASSEDMGTTVKSFWSDLSFTNSYAYTLVGSTYTGLEVGFEVSWTPVGGETTNKTFALDAKTIQAWADAEFGKTVEDYCFFVQLTGFEDLPTDGVITVKPYAKTAFQTLTEVEATEYEHEYVEPATLTYELGFGIVPAM